MRVFVKQCFQREGIFGTDLNIAGTGTKFISTCEFLFPSLLNIFSFAHDPRAS